MKLLLIFALFAFILNVKADTLPRITTTGIAEGLAIHAITQDKTGMLWLGTDKGLYSYDGYDLRSYNVRGLDIINCLRIKGETMFVGSIHGLRIFSLRNHQFIPGWYHHGESVRDINGDWIGTNKGLYYKHHKIGRFNDIYSIWIHAGKTYVGTNENLWKLDKYGFKLFSKGYYVVNTITESCQNSLLIGSYTTLTEMDARNEIVKRTNKLPVVKSILQEHHKTMIGTDDGLYVMEQGKINKFVHNAIYKKNSIADNVVWCLFRDQDKNIWIGTDNGLSVIEFKSDIQWYSLPDITKSSMGNKIDCMLIDSHKRVWMGGTQGILCVEHIGLANQQCRWYKMNDRTYPIRHNRIRDVFEDSKHRLWVCTDGGLLLYNEQSKQLTEKKIKMGKPLWTYHISENKNGDLSVVVYDSIMILDGNKLFIKSRFKKKIGKLPTKEFYIDNEKRHWFADKASGILYNGGTDVIGFSTKKAIEKSELGRKVTITGVTVNRHDWIGIETIARGEIELNYNENNLEIAFTDFNYSSGKMTQYYYKLDGINDSWIPLKVKYNKIEIPNLPYGTYTLLISPDKSETLVTRLEIHIHAPWYLTVPMKILYLLFLVVFVIAIIVFSVQRKTLRMEREQRDMMLANAKQKEQELQKELVKTVKNENISDSIVSADDSLLMKITQYIEAHMEEPDLSPGMLCDYSRINQKQLYRKIKQLTGMTTIEYIRHVRIEHAANLLSHGNFTVAEVMYRVGFTNASYFSRVFNSQYNMTPSEYKKTI